MLADKNNNAAITVALATDQNLARYCPTVLNSISRNTSTHVNVVMLCRGLKESECKALQDLNLDRISVEIIPMDGYLEETKLSLLAHTTLATMDRIFLPDLLPDLGKILYLDIDIIILGDLTELFSLQTPECGICAKSSIHPKYSTMNTLIESWGTDNGRLRQLAENRGSLMAKCFNAGVLVMDLDKLRNSSFVSFTLDVVEKFGVNDQLAINLFAAGKHGELDPGWNVFVGQDDPLVKNIIHWAGPHKPWGQKPVPESQVWRSYYMRVDALDRDCLAGQND